MRARGAVVMTLLGVMAMSALYPLRQYAAQDSHVNALVRQSRALQAKITELQHEQSVLQTDDEIERIAREELGMVRPGEVAFAVVNGSAGPADPKPASKPESGSGPAWYQRWWDATVHAVTGMR